MIVHDMLWATGRRFPFFQGVHSELHSSGQANQSPMIKAYHYHAPRLLGGQRLVEL